MALLLTLTAAQNREFLASCHFYLRRIATLFQILQNRPPTILRLTTLGRSRGPCKKERTGPEPDCTYTVKSSLEPRFELG